VGVHNNQPLAFVDADGQAKGFLIDILEYIGAKEGWRLDYIDLAVGIEYSRERNEVYDFTYEDVFSDWGAVYTQEGSDINQIVNLDNKKIAVVHDDNHYHNIRNLAQQLKLKCRFVEAYEYDAVLELIARKKVDAGVVNRLYGLEFSTNYKINRSPIIFSHTEVHFVVPKWTPTNVKWQLPKWFMGILAAAGGLLVLFLVTGLILRAQVKSKTAELSFMNFLSSIRNYLQKLLNASALKRCSGLHNSLLTTPESQLSGWGPMPNLST
jgi:hypothetical protein